MGKGEWTVKDILGTLWLYIQLVAVTPGNFFFCLEGQGTTWTSSGVAWRLGTGKAAKWQQYRLSLGKGWVSWNGYVLSKSRQVVDAAAGKPPSILTWRRPRLAAY